jgi:2-polyprenyl-3-methyl-5-hydroxy-6-metoxy-1,4-benzoquinol methylase
VAEFRLLVQSDRPSHGYLAEYYYGSAEAPHTEVYLWRHIISLVAELGARRIVDIGSGNGALCRKLASRGYEVVGCEPSADGVRFAQSAAPELVFHQLGVDDNPMAVGNERFDVAIATEVIEHLVRPRNLPRFAKQLLRPGGHLIISTPYHGYLKNLVLAVTNNWDAHLNPFWDGGHIKFWSRKTLSQLLNETGFRIVRFIGAGRLPFLWKSMILVAQKPQPSEQWITEGLAGQSG